MNKSDLKKAFVASIPVMTGYISLGIGFGILLESKGYGPAWAFLMSFAVYAGSLQYVLVDMMAGGVSLVTTALTSLMVNARHLFYGISMVEPYQRVRHKPFLIFTLTDETYSLVSHRERVEAQEEPTRYCFFVSLLNYAYWISGSVIGAAIGAVLPFSTEGIDFALTALFLTIFTEQWLSAKKHAPAVIGVLCSVLALLLLGRDDFLLLAMALILLLLWLSGKREVERRG